MGAITDTLRARTELAARVTAGTLTISDPPGPGPGVTGIAGDDGASLDLLWIQDADRPAELEIVIFTGAQPVTYDEAVNLAVVIQTIRRGESSTWDACNQAAEQIVGEVVGALATAPQYDGETGDPSVDGFEALVRRVDWASGYLPDGTGYMVRAVLELEVSARLELA